MKIRILALLSMLFIFLCLISVNAEASDQKALISSFGVEIIKPNSQIDLNKDYFNIKVEPGEAQEIKVKMIPFTNSDISVDVYLADATTSSNLEIIYPRNEAKNDDTLQNSIADIVKVDQSSITLKNQEPQEISFIVNPPKEKFEGIKLGTLYFEERNNEKSNTIRYSIDILISEKPPVIDGGKTLNFLTAKSDLRNEQKQVFLEFQNPTPLIISELNMDISIMNADTNSYVKKNIKKSGRMAPNSKTTLPIDLGTNTLKEGTYQVIVNATSSNEEWELKQQFVVDGNSSINDSIGKKLSEASVNTDIIIVILIIIILILCIIIFINKKNKKRRKNEKKK